MRIYWNGYYQPHATLEAVIEQAAGYCADHSDLSKCDCEPHELRCVSTDNRVDVTINVPRT